MLNERLESSTNVQPGEVLYWDSELFYWIGFDPNNQTSELRPHSRLWATWLNLWTRSLERKEYVLKTQPK